MKPARALVVASAFAVLALVVAACNTVKGVGTDLQKGAEATSKAIDKVAELGFDPQYGARPLKRVLQRAVVNELSKQILSGAVEKDAVILVDVDDQGGFYFENAEENVKI